MISFTTILFVGGESRRMGADKATLFYDGEPLWSRQLRTLRTLSPERIFISARSKPPWCPPDVEVILDVSPACGPLSGIATALGKIRTTHLLALAVDMPLMTVEHLRWLQSHIHLGCGIVPLRHGRTEPLCAIYPVEASGLALVAVNAGEFALRSLVAALCEEKMLAACQLTEDMEHLYQNANSPDDLANLPGFRSNR